MDRTTNLDTLHADFRAGSTTSMPIAGMICWAALAVAAQFISAQMTGTLALYIMGGILPLAFLIDKMRGRNLFASNGNPLDQLFLTSIVGVAVTVPLVLFAASLASNSDIIVLGMAILAGVIWIPYGWAADDKVGLVHAVLRAIGCYAAFAYVPEAYRASAVCGMVVLSYIYTLIFMKRVGS
jgi:hypothetical protein